MRILAVVLSVLLIASALAAAPAPLTPEKEGPSLEDSVKYINEHLYISNDSNGNCRDRVQVSLSDNHEEMIVKHLLVDRDGRIKDGVEPRYVYHVPIAAVRSVYLSGPWTTQDRVVVRTDGKVVRKYGPVWDCSKSKLNTAPKISMLASVDLRVQEAEQGHVGDVAKAVNHVVKLLQSELGAKPGSQPKENPDPEKKDKLTDKK
jgi:hypothetical protein